MKLAYSPISPFARKVRIAAIELGIIDKIEFVSETVAPGTANEKYQAITPLKKLPVLILSMLLVVFIVMRQATSGPETIALLHKMRPMYEVSTVAVEDYFGYGRDAAALQDKAQDAYSANKNPNYFEAGTLLIDLVDSKTITGARKTFDRGKIVATRVKTLLPTYDVFDEDRYFEPAEENTPVEFQGRKVGLTVCEDVWNDEDFWPDRLYRRDPVKELIALAKVKPGQLNYASPGAGTTSPSNV